MHLQTTLPLSHFISHWIPFIEILFSRQDSQIYQINFIFVACSRGFEVMSYNHVYPRCCLNSSDSSGKSKESPSGQFKLYQFFVFCVPIFFTFILLFVFYLFYLRPRRVNWSSLRMTTSPQINNDIATVRIIYFLCPSISLFVYLFAFWAHIICFMLKWFTCRLNWA